MNGGRVAKRLLAVALALSTLVTLGLYYNSANYRHGSRQLISIEEPPRALGNGGAPARRPDRPSDEAGEEDVEEGVSNDVAVYPDTQSPLTELSAAVDRDTCPELPLANTTVDTVTEFSRFEFQVSETPASGATESRRFAKGLRGHRIRDVNAKPFLSWFCIHLSGAIGGVGVSEDQTAKAVVFENYPVFVFFF